MQSTILAAPKKRTNLSISEPLLAEAKSLGINLSQAAESGIKQAIVSARRAQWLTENSHALASANAYIKQYGLPLARFRTF